MMNFISRYLTDESGATAVEYGLIGASIAVAISATVFLIGEDINGFLTYILEQLQA